MTHRVVALTPMLAAIAIASPSCGAQGLAQIKVQPVRTALSALRGHFPMIVIEHNRAFIDGPADTVLTLRGGPLEVSSSARA